MNRAARKSVARGLALLAGLAWAGSAPGQESVSPGPRLGVAVLGGVELPTAERAALEESLWGEALMHSGAGLAWRLVIWSGQSGAEDEKPELVALTRALAEGKQAYRYLKLDEARRIFEGALARLERRPVLGCQAAQVAELYLYWARAELDSGEAGGAQALLGQVQRFDPKALPDPATMPPNLVATFDVALDDRRVQPRGQVLVQSGPGRAALRLDCRVQAAGVVQWNGVAGDGLWLAAEVEGGMVRARLTVPAGARRELTVWSGQAGQGARLRALQAGLKSPVTPEALGPLAVLADVELILVAERLPEGDAFGLRLVSPLRGTIGEPVRVPRTARGRPDPERLQAAVAELADRLRAETGASEGGTVAGQEPGPPPRLDPLPPEPRPVAEATGEVEPATPWYQTWWFWTAAGGVVVAGVLTGVLLAVTRDSQPSGDVVITLGRP
jgi:hypothetical protein